MLSIGGVESRVEYRASVCECVCLLILMWLYLFLRPFQLGHDTLSFQHFSWGGGVRVALEIKTHKAGFGYLLFIHCSVMLCVDVVSICAVIPPLFV